MGTVKTAEQEQLRHILTAAVIIAVLILCFFVFAWPSIKASRDATQANYQRMQNKWTKVGSPETTLEITKHHFIFKSPKCDWQASYRREGMVVIFPEVSVAILSGPPRFTVETFQSKGIQDKLVVAHKSGDDTLFKEFPGEYVEEDLIKVDSLKK
jgi:hypothetical protein